MRVKRQEEVGAGPHLCKTISNLALNYRTMPFRSGYQRLPTDEQVKMSETLWLNIFSLWQANFMTGTIGSCLFFSQHGLRFDGRHRWLTKVSSEMTLKRMPCLLRLKGSLGSLHLLSWRMRCLWPINWTQSFMTMQKSAYTIFPCVAFASIE